MDTVNVGCNLDSALCSAMANTNSKLSYAGSSGISTSVSGSAGTNTITVASATGIARGMSVSGTGISSSAYVTNISGRHCQTCHHQIPRLCLELLCFRTDRSCIRFPAYLRHLPQMLTTRSITALQRLAGQLVLQYQKREAEQAAAISLICPALAGCQWAWPCAARGLETMLSCRQ